MAKTHDIILLLLYIQQVIGQDNVHRMQKGDSPVIPQGYSYNPVYDACEQDDPLGMISGAITDSQISASSFMSDSWSNKECSPLNARPFTVGKHAWCPKFKSSTEYLQIDLGVRATLTGVMLQGRGDTGEYVTSFTVSYSDDAIFWTSANDQYGNQKIFEGNIDEYQSKHCYLDKPIVTRYFRIHPFTWNRHPSLRLELIGCQPCKQLLGTPPYTKFGASSSKSNHRGRTCNPEDGHYLSNKAWCAKRQNTMQWFQLDLGPPTLITGIVLRSRGDGKWQQHVTHFKVSYSNDSQLWFFYKEASHLDQKIFLGNSQLMPERVHYLAAPIITRYVRIHPVSWQGKIAMRVGLLGCRHKGPCGPGFFRVNGKSSCVANLAYKKDAWMSNNPENPRKKITDIHPSPIFSSPYSSTRFAYPLTSSTESPGDSYFSTSGSPIELSKNTVFPSNEQRNQILSMSTPINDWKIHDVMMGDQSHGVKDEAAGRAVDGFIVENDADEDDDVEDEQLKLALMNDEPMKPKRALRSAKNNNAFGQRPVHQCTILKYTWPFHEAPGWHVDLQDSFVINGIILYTAGHGKVESYRDLISHSLEGTSELVMQMNNLERIFVYVEDEEGGPRQICGQVTRLNDAVFLPRLHVSCRRPVTGRYLFVEAHGLRGTWPKDYFAALCEVQVY